MTVPRYKVYIPSKGRAETCITPVFLHDANIAFQLVVEPQDYEAYIERFGKEWVLMLPENDKGIAYSRNAIKKHSKNLGELRHWQIDDDIKGVLKLHKGKKIDYPANVALSAIEDFVDRYENIALAGLKSRAFTAGVKAPFNLNKNVYGCVLVDSSLPFNWRSGNEDTDMSLQVLMTDYWCTVLIQMFLFEGGFVRKEGGNSETIYKDEQTIYKTNLEFARNWSFLKIDPHERVEPQINRVWMRFTQRLIKREGVKTEKSHKYDTELVARSEVKSEHLKRMLDDQN